MTQKFIDLLNSINDEILTNPDVDLIEDGIIDSLDIMNIISEIVSQFNVIIDPSEVNPESFASAEKIWELVCNSQEV